MKLLLINQSHDRVPEKWLGKWVKGLSQSLSRRRHSALTRKELVVVFVNSGEMKRMNKLYRGKNYATDVLSFETPEKGVVGELVLCLPVLRSQSRRTGLKERGELGYMIVHGVLHLLGYDHGTREDEIKMFGLQDEIYRELESRIGFR